MNEVVMVLNHMLEFGSMVVVMMWIGILLYHVVKRLHHYLTAIQPKIYFNQEQAMQHLRVLQHCPSIAKEKYYPTFYLWNGHLQTIALGALNETKHPVVTYDRELVHFEDGGMLALDWAQPVHFDKDQGDFGKTKPVMLILHGLTGDSQEYYVRCLVEHMRKEEWIVVVMNARGCGDTPVQTPKTFCAACTNDIRHIVHHLRSMFPITPIVAVGFSLGSNILVKYLGEEGNRVKLDAAVSIGNPFDLMETTRSLKRTWMKRNVYNRFMASGLRKYVERIDARSIFADHPTVDIEKAMKALTVEEFDEHFVRRMYNYETLHSYYRDGSSDSYILRVRIPLLCLNAEDDPICVKSSIPYDECSVNPSVLLVTTSKGGHLSFFTGNRWPPRFWATQVVAEYVKATLNVLAEDRQLLRLGLSSETFQGTSNQRTYQVGQHVHFNKLNINASMFAIPPEIPLESMRRMDGGTRKARVKKLRGSSLVKQGTNTNKAREKTKLETKQEMKKDMKKDMNEEMNEEMNEQMDGEMDEARQDVAPVCPSLLCTTASTAFAVATVAVALYTAMYGRKKRQGTKFLSK